MEPEKPIGMGETRRKTNLMKEPSGDSNHREQERAKVITLKLEVPAEIENIIVDKDGKKHKLRRMQYNVQGMKRLTKAIIDEHIDMTKSRLTREQLNEIMEAYSIFCFAEKAGIESLPVGAEIKFSKPKSRIEKSDKNTKLLQEDD